MSLRKTGALLLSALSNLKKLVYPLDYTKTFKSHLEHWEQQTVWQCRKLIQHFSSNCLRQAIVRGETFFSENRDTCKHYDPAPIVTIDLYRPYVVILLRVCRSRDMGETLLRFIYTIGYPKYVLIQGKGQDTFYKLFSIWIMMVKMARSFVE